jgi:ADP-ribose pyrophosphatase YjhB (NUDIX family)
MDVDRPAPGEHLNPGEPTTPRQAASVIVLRDGSDGLEVLLLRRNPNARFMGGAWVFPGGAVDAHEGEGDLSHRIAAVREVEEEAGLRLPDLAPLPRGQEPRADGEEMVALGWHAPAGALDAHRRGALQLVFPTIKQLEQLAGFPSATALLEWAEGREVVAVEPRVLMTGEAARLVLPGEPGYP